MLKKVLLAVAFLCAASPALAAKELELWHAMRGPSADEMGRLVEQFNASQSEFRVVATYKGSYEETLAAALAAHKAGKGPDLLQVYDAGTADLMAGKDVVRPLWQVMSESGHAVDAKYLPAVAGYYSDEKGRLLALPLSTATPVLYYNRDAFKRAQLDPDKAPKTWYEIPKTLGALRESGVSCPMTTAWPSWVLFENMTAWHNEEFATHHNGMDGHGARLSFNGRLMVRWISMLSSWMKAGYFEYSGRAAEGEARFVSGECAVLTSSSASYGELRENAKFDLGVAQLPYYDDIGGAPHNTLTGGAALWVMGGKPKPDYHGIAKFLAFLAKPERQAEWTQKTGFVPATMAAYELSRQQGFYAKYPAYEVAVHQLILKQPNGDTRGIRLLHLRAIRTIIDEELELVWKNKKTPLEALNSMVARGNALLAR
ncbi:MAG TPA: sn-glycerol-3-phosphate ABC transporter substrate-binding protein UgpB [Burkholderiales bacterium]|nr:sn-glycerol-3-phosphate ABC transporter substrate-binding protein UgpB [Burkholderiales bacterium]